MLPFLLLLVSTAVQAPLGAAPSKEPKQEHSCSNLRKAQTALTRRLIEILGTQKKSSDSVVFSPASLAAVLGTLDRGADHDMREAILRTLGFDGQAAEDHAIFDCFRAAKPAAKAAGETLRLANAIIFSQIQEKSPALVASLRADRTSVLFEDLRHPAAIARVNDWSKKETAGLVPEVLSEPISDPGLVALNLLYFKAQWTTAFDPKQTTTEPFTSADGQKSDTPMMHAPARYTMIQADNDFLALDLPFGDGHFSLTMVTTVDRPANAALLANASDWLSAQKLELRNAEVSIPKLLLSVDNDLLASMDALGLAPARSKSSSLASFADGVILSKLEQRVVVQIDETGAETAAATSAMATRSYEGKPFQAKFDKPFIFALRDHETGMILVAGYIDHP